MLLFYCFSFAALNFVLCTLYHNQANFTLVGLKGLSYFILSYLIVIIIITNLFVCLFCSVNNDCFIFYIGFFFACSLQMRARVFCFCEKIIIAL